jgi:hypothetical protein
MVSTATATKTLSMKNILGRALRETGAAMKESGRSEVCTYINVVIDLLFILMGMYVSIFFSIDS